MTVTVRVHALKTSKYRDHLKALSLTRNVFKRTVYLVLMSLNFLLNQKLHELNGECHYCRELWNHVFYRSFSTVPDEIYT